VSPSLDNIVPAFAKQRFNDANQAFVCESGTKFVTGIDSSYRAHYNPCDSSLTSSNGKVGAAVLVNSLLTVLSLGTNVVTGSSVFYVNTDKDKVAKLVVDSKLFRCLEEANRNGLKADIVASAAMVAKATEKESYDAGKADLEKLGGSDCSGNSSVVSAETYYKRGKVLISMNRYKEAIACFERVQGEATDKGIYQDSCYQISIMYELGWGVDKDTEKAKFWLKKAGL
jgi:TPR repeat protein